MEKIKIAVCGYGNLGRGVEAAVGISPDMELAAIFTRREPSSVIPLTADVPVLPFSDIAGYSGKIDVVVNCGGSATDLPVTTPAIAALFNTVDSYDNHSMIPRHFEAVDAAASGSGHVAAISVGWDPGLFSVARLYMNAALPEGKDYTFWGRGVSQGHSDAVRRIPGVVDARQYTVPVPKALERVRKGENPDLTAGQKHTREVFAVAEPGADRAAIEESIKTMPAYFADYDTTVTFISAEEMKRDHSGIPHGGCVIRNGMTGGGAKHTAEFSLKLESNPEFTGSVLAAYARAVHRLSLRGESGAFTVFDIPPVLLSPESPEYLRAHLL
ncbi:MAG: diaminopimelate dehydrogenase [Clostridia bacterium]|nr:diaminopimelate dehydrogenase [Clostridia bacterium]